MTKGPRKKNDQGKRARQKAFLRALYEARGAQTLATVLIGIHRSTLWHWKKDPKFVEEIDLVRRKLVRILVDQLWDLARAGNTTALIFALKSFDPETFDHDLRRVKYNQARIAKPIIIQFVDEDSTKTH